MLNQSLHSSEQELLLYADGELSRRRAAQVRAHLAKCWDCRARVAEIEGTITEFMRIRRDALDPQLPPIAGPRALLKARLTRLAPGSHRERWRQILVALNRRSLAFACAAALVVALGASVLRRKTADHESAALTDARVLPDSSLTPGATRTVTMGDICSQEHDEVVRPVSETLRQKVFDEYGINGAPTENYEVDYLISPGLGGADDIRDLWPQPRYDTIWSSFVKDQLEDYLHGAVCGGNLSLAAAQKDIAGNWISAYKKYFHADEPLARDSVSDLPRSIWLAVSGVARRRDPFGEFHSRRGARDS